MRRTALMGGSLVWATPTVQSLSRVAFATTVGSPSPARSGSAPAKVTLLLRVDPAAAPAYFQITVEAGRPGFDHGPKALPRGAARDTWDALTGGYRVERGRPVGVDASGGGADRPAVIDVGNHEVVEWGVYDGAWGERLFFTRSLGRIPPGFDVRQDGTVLQFTKHN